MPYNRCMASTKAAAETLLTSRLCPVLTGTGTELPGGDSLADMSQIAPLSWQ